MNQRCAFDCSAVHSARASRKGNRVPRFKGNDPERRLPQIVIASLVLLAIATVLVAPSIDMPDTVLLVHHTGARAAGGHAAGNFTVSETTYFSQVNWPGDALREIDSLLLSRGGHGQQAIVLRC
jgi:hypothetical protein